jgi:hypothetical protein
VICLQERNASVREEAITDIFINARVLNMEIARSVKV